MKFIPRRDQIIGRIVIKRVLSMIVRPNEIGATTKFVLIDGVGPGAAAAGYKPGDVILPTQMGNIQLDGGVMFRPLVEEKNVAALVEVDRADLVVQSNSGNKFVPFDDPEAAQSVCSDFGTPAKEKAA